MIQVGRMIFQMEPIEFLKVCFCIVYAVISFAIYVKVLFAFIDWLAEQIYKMRMTQQKKKQRRKENDGKRDV